MRVFYTDHFTLPLPEEHRFPMAKYALLREAVVAAELVEPAALSAPAPATDEELRRVHTSDWVRRVTRGELEPAEIRRLGFPWSPELVERSRRSVGATIAACRSALESGCGVNLAGGTHHAFADRGGGYCVFNDVAVALKVLQAEGRMERGVVVDCDVHQGDGTASIFAADPAVFTLSLHGRHNYPFRKETSDLDVALADGTGDAEYLEALATALAALPPWKPSLAVYLAGADPYAGDRLGKLGLTAAGLEARDRLVLGSFRRAEVPVAIVMAGGYAPRVEEIVAIHARTVTVAAELFSVPPAPRAAQRSGQSV